MLVVLLFVFFEYARAGAEPIPDGMATPQELSALIRLQEDRVWSSVSRLNLSGEANRLHNSLKSLREAIQHVMQNVGSIGQKQEYRAIVSEVETLCGQVQGLPPELPEAAATGHLADTSDDLRRRVEQLAAMLIRQPS